MVINWIEAPREGDVEIDVNPEHILFIELKPFSEFDKGDDQPYYVILNFVTGKTLYFLLDTKQEAEDFRKKIKEVSGE